MASKQHAFVPPITTEGDEGDMKHKESLPLLSHHQETQFRPFGLFWNIVKSFAGAGTFALPWAVMNAGLWTGTIGIIIIAIFSNYTIKTLLQCGEKVMSMKGGVNSSSEIVPPSYPEIGKAAVGEIGSVLVSVYSGAMCFGVCIAYFTLIGGNMHDLITKIPVSLFIWIVVPICIFLSILTDLRALAYSSIAGSVALVIAMVAVIEYGLEHHLLKPVHDYPAITLKTIPLFLGGAAFLFCDHVIVLPLANSCGDFKKFPRILDYAVTFVTLINVVFAGLSYAYWGSGTCGNVIGNLGEGNVVADIVRVGISLEVMASFPLVISAGFQSLETAFPNAMRPLKAFPKLPPDAPHPLFSRNIIYYIFRGGVVAVLALLASTITQFGELISLIGSLTIAATGFIFPQVFYLKLFGNELKWYDQAWQVAIIIFGVGMTVLGTEQSLMGMIHPTKGHC